MQLKNLVTLSQFRNVVILVSRLLNKIGMAGSRYIAIVRKDEQILRFLSYIREIT